LASNFPVSRQGFQKRPDLPVQYRMNQVRRDVVQGREDELPLVQARMRNAEARSVNDPGAVEEQVQIQRTGPVPPVRASAQGAFHSAERSNGFRRREVSFGLHDQVQKVAGSLHSYRFCLIDSGPPLNLEPLQFQQLKTAPDIIRASAQVTADADVHSRHGLRLAEFRIAVNRDEKEPESERVREQVRGACRLQIADY
jgi:hypothetical protein